MPVEEQRSLFLRLALLVASVVRVVVRFRRGGEVVRRQLKWFCVSPPVAADRGTWAAYLVPTSPVSWPRSGCSWVFVSLG
jgi:hypothetical protein